MARAFLLSLLCHGVLFGLLEVAQRYDLWRLAPLAALARALQLEPARAPQAAAPPVQPAEELPVIFVDVDPSQATTELPPATKFYSATASVAANPDTSRDTGIPKLYGSQEQVLKTSDTLRAAAAAPAVAEALRPAPLPAPPA
ncbi:MAG: hypothetical protein FJ387_22240, partial [Verrucomicrobia bacterium]|nr:hypothetical protein [Verrucomicrobiota bacterium]